MIGDNDIKTAKNKISISSIKKNNFQPRRNFEKEALEELTNRLKKEVLFNQLLLESQNKKMVSLK